LIIISKTSCGDSRYCDGSGNCILCVESSCAGVNCDALCPEDPGAYTCWLDSPCYCHKNYDCPTGGMCNYDGDCDPGESYNGCCQDCPCPGGQVCDTSTGYCYTPPPGEGNNPKGWHDFSDCRASEGWACDPDDYSQPLEIHFYADGPAGSGTFIGSTIANKESVRELENG